MTIKVFVNTLQENHVLNANNHKRTCVLFDTKETIYDVDRFIFKIIDMVADWPNELEDKSILDGLEYRISIKDKDKEVLFRFKNKFPENINKLHHLIEEVSEVAKNVN